MWEEGREGGGREGKEGRRRANFAFLNLLIADSAEPEKLKMLSPASSNRLHAPERRPSSSNLLWFWLRDRSLMKKEKEGEEGGGGGGS